MAESPLKRQREVTPIEDLVEETKRSKPSSYNNILSLLEEEEEEEEPAQDLSSLMSRLQHELSSESNISNSLPSSNTASDKEIIKPISSSPSSSSCSKDDDDEADDKERVLRHLLEASDDELGIPSSGAGGVVDVDKRGDDGEVVGVNSDSVDGFGFGFCDGLWDLEDEAANYNILLQ